MTQPILTRRRLLCAPAATLALAACGGPAEERVEPLYANALVIAHRGGGRDWPEMTVHAYQEASKLVGLSAMEVSVRRSRDGVLVCHHDETTKRVTGVDLDIAKTDWAELRKLKVTPLNNFDHSQPSQPLARIEQVLEVWPDDMAIWAEPKSRDAVDPLFALLKRHRNQQVVWKRWINADFRQAKQAGWDTFGYVLGGAAQMALLRRAEPLADIDNVGVAVEEDDQRVAEVVRIAGDHGRRTVMWALDTVEERDRALRLGCLGLMSSAVRELLAAPMPVG